MPYEITDNTTGEVITFENDPNDADIQEAFGTSQNIPKTESQIRQQISKITSANLPSEPSVYQKYIKPVAEPTVAYTGLGLGAAAGIAGGPAGWMTSPILAGAGYASAKQAYRIAEELAGVSKPEPTFKQLVRSGREVLSGMEQQMTGAIGGRLLSGKPAMNPLTGEETMEGGLINRAGQVYKGLRGVLSSAKIKAGKVLEKERTLVEPYTSNVKTAEKVEEQIPGFNLTYGQRSDFPLAVRGETVSARKDALGAVLFKKYEAGNKTALKDYIKNKFPEQGDIDDVINVIKPQLEAFKKTQTLTKDAVDSMIADMPNITATGVQQTGNVVRGLLNKAKLNTWKQSQELYKEINYNPINSSKTLQALKDYETEIIARNDPPSVISPVSSIIKQLEDGAEIKQKWDSRIGQFTQEQFSNLLQLKGLRGQSFKTAYQSTDYQLANNARKVGRIIDENMEIEAQKIGGDFWNKFRTAQDFFNKEYVGKFRLGTVGNVLKPGGDAISRYAKTDSEVIGEFFRGDKKGLERINDLTNALGKENVQDMVKDYAVYDFKNYSINKFTGNVIPKKLADWYGKNESILKSVGIDKDFSTLLAAQKVVNASMFKVTDFEKSIAGKMLTVDTDHAMKIAFEGKSGKNAGIIANQLMDIVKGNPAAENGLRVSFKDFLIQQVEKDFLQQEADMTAKTIANNAILSKAATNRVMNQYGNAIRAIWRDEPEKVKALYTFQAATNILWRNMASQFAGSQTSEYEAAMKSFETLPFMGYKGVVARFIIRLEEHLGKTKINDLITQGRFDPNFADHLIRMAKTFDKTRNFESLKGFSDKIADMLGVMPIPGGRGETLGKTLGVYGASQIPYLLETQEKISYNDKGYKWDNGQLTPNK